MTISFVVEMLAEDPEQPVASNTRGAPSNEGIKVVVLLVCLLVVSDPILGGFLYSILKTKKKIIIAIAVTTWNRRI